MRVAVYVRVSGHRQTQTQTIEQQLQRLQAYSMSQGWIWHEEDIFRDDGYSGAKLKRPGLDRLRDHIARAAFDPVLVTAQIGWLATMSIRCSCSKSSSEVGARCSFWIVR